jgi:hypothetical protein
MVMIAFIWAGFKDICRLYLRLTGSGGGSRKTAIFLCSQTSNWSVFGTDQALETRRSAHHHRRAMCRRLLPLAVILLLLVRHPAMGQAPFLPAPETQEDNQQLFQQMQQELAAKESRLRDIENQLYEWRDPTPEEVESKRKDWSAANPFKTSFDMPDFAKQKIRVRRADGASAQQQGDAQALQDRISKLEASIEAMKARAPKVNPQPAIAVVTQPPKPPSQPEPSSVAILKHSDGSVSVSIGSEFFQFKNEAEAKAYVDKRLSQPFSPAKQ